MTKRKTLDERAYEYADKEWPPRDDRTKVTAAFAAGCGFDGARDGWLSGYQAAWRDMRRKFGKRTARLRSASPDTKPRSVDATHRDPVSQEARRDG